MMQDLQDSHIRATSRDTQVRDSGEGVRAAPGTGMDTNGEPIRAVHTEFDARCHDENDCCFYDFVVVISSIRCTVR
jgi:hypothetical protein